MGEVAGVARVAVIPFLDRAAVARLHLTVQRGVVGRRGEDERDRARELVEQPPPQPARVSRQAERVRGRALLARERDVAAASDAQRGSRSTPVASRSSWIASTRVVPMPHMGSSTSSPGWL